MILDYGMVIAAPLNAVNCPMHTYGSFLLFLLSLMIWWCIELYYLSSLAVFFSNLS
jgi:hypothetical protein